MVKRKIRIYFGTEESISSLVALWRMRKCDIEPKVFKSNLKNSKELEKVFNKIKNKFLYLDD